MTRTPESIILALDTSTRTVGIALYNGVQVLGELAWTSRDFHTVELAPAVSELLEKTHLKTNDLSALAVALGPGSFTGLRIGMALAKGLALARHLPITGIPTLDILAAAQPLPIDGRTELLAAVLQAGRGRLAIGWYHVKAGAWTSSQPLEVLTHQELSDRIQSPAVICGELTEEERRHLSRKRKLICLASPAFSQRRPSFLAELGWQRWQAGQVDDPISLSPIYLHYNEPIPG
jgi:tRNA threonylcarbamoyladenosine biosynthesis protein TsaB